MYIYIDVDLCVHLYMYMHTWKKVALRNKTNLQLVEGKAEVPYIYLEL